MWIFKVVEKLKEYKIKFAIAGGYAVALHGAVRGTVDLDLVIALDSNNFINLEKALSELNLKSRLPVTAKEVFQFRKEYVEKRNLIAWSFINNKNPSEIVDIILTHDLKKMRIKHFSVQGVRLPVLSIKDLIKMKVVAGRPQDLEDVLALKEIDED